MRGRVPGSPVPVPGARGGGARRQPHVTHRQPHARPLRPQHLPDQPGEVTHQHFDRPQPEESELYANKVRIEESIGFDSSNSSTVQLKRLVKEHFKGKTITQPAKAFDLAIACLEEGATGNSIERERSESSELVEDLVKLIHEDRNGLSPITLTEISDYLDTGKNSLNKACKETFGMNVLELTKVVRLEQVRKSLSNPTISSGLRLFTKERIAEYYGFSKWTTFEELYFRSYLENPEDTIEKTRDISIGVSALGGEQKI